MSSKAEMIITADDFGRDAACTGIIAESLTTGSITAASLMANGSHFEEACRLVRSERLDGRIGVHLSLDEGPPLSREMRPYIDSSGQLSMKRRLRRLGAGLAAAVEAELSAQVDRVLAAGIRPTHLDSHRHIHTVFPIGRLVVRVARRYRIPYVRPARNLATSQTASAGFYKWLFNRYLSGRVRTADYFGDVVDFYRRPGEYDRSGLIECMTHLDDSPRGVENRELLQSDEFRRFVQRFRLIGHADRGR